MLMIKIEVSSSKQEKPCILHFVIIKQHSLLQSTCKHFNFRQYFHLFQMCEMSLFKPLTLLLIGKMHQNYFSQWRKNEVNVLIVYSTSQGSEDNAN